MHIKPGKQFQAAVFPCNFKEFSVIKNGTRGLKFVLIACVDAHEELLDSDSPEFESLGLQR